MIGGSSRTPGLVTESKIDNSVDSDPSVLICIHKHQEVRRLHRVCKQTHVPAATVHCVPGKPGQGQAVQGGDYKGCSIS
eukprot:123120-Hanusia_phi.AAC.1